jgi:uncharacterized protein
MLRVRAPLLSRKGRGGAGTEEESGRTAEGRRVWGGSGAAGGQGGEEGRQGGERGGQGGGRAREGEGGREGKNTQ